MSDVTPRSRSLFQVSVAVAVIGVLAAALLNALHYVQEKAERTVMEATVRNMGKGLEIELQTRVIRGRPGSSRELVGANPIQWLESPPEGYVGSCGRELAPGEWCFDAASKEVVYRPRLAASLEFRTAGRRELRWRVGSADETAGGQGANPVATGAIGLVSTTSFVWH
jgi:hypothetical protein